MSRRLPCRWLRAPAQAGRTRAGPPPVFAQKREAIHLHGTQNLAQKQEPAACRLLLVNFNDLVVAVVGFAKRIVTGV